MFISELFPNDLEEGWKDTAKKVAAGAALAGALAVNPAHAKGGEGGGHGSSSGHGSFGHSGSGGDSGGGSGSRSAPIAPRGSNLGKAKFNPDSGEFEIPPQTSHVTTYIPHSTSCASNDENCNKKRGGEDIRNMKFNPKSGEFEPKTNEGKKQNKKDKEVQWIPVDTVQHPAGTKYSPKNKYLDNPDYNTRTDSKIKTDELTQGYPD